MDSEHHRGFEIQIEQDEMDINPLKDWDCLCNFKSLHGNYGEALSNVDGYNETEELNELMNSGDVIFLPLYMYEHGDIGLSTNNSYYPYNCPWDAGQLGFVWLEKDKILEEYNWKIFTKKRIQQIEKRLRQNVEVMHDYVSGNVYGFVVEDMKGNHIDSCWGFYGYEHDKSGLLDQAKGAINWYITDERKKHAEYLKRCISGNVPLQHRRLAIV